ncbi:MAG: Mut7-C RNAse domain-containing protein [candidate division NC10 bacterium]|nr:Mut7-C RNAse domain-containing protein [candidate division NC10 bacterium]
MGRAKFIADTMLGRLAKWLRILGYDTIYFSGTDDGLLLQMAREGGRILLTRDTRLLQHKGLGRYLFIQSDHLKEQLRQVVAELKLDPEEGLGSRCPRCNAELGEIEKGEVEGRVPEFVFKQQEDFFHCHGCGRIYWPGSHLQKMMERVREICG